MIRQSDMMKVIQQHRGDAVVVPVFRASPRWKEVSDRPELDLPVGGAMGKASSFAMGVALARPDKNVILLDGDGSLEMNLGSLVTIGEQAPSNMYHFVVQNGVYASTGGQPIVGADTVSFKDIALSAGYKHGYDFDDLEEFSTTIPDIFSNGGPALITVRIVPEIRSPEERAAERASAGNQPGWVPYHRLKDELEKV
tara:strand:+ start:894 stop:1484 length:591 start_codon:yes stop_codon:yes gene_type:complete